MTLMQSSLTVAPHSTQKMQFRVTIPNSATPGGHYGAVMFKNQDSATGSQIQFEKKIASIILLTVSGAISENLALNSSGITINQISSGSNAGGGTSFNPNSIIDTIPWYQSLFGTLQNDSTQKPLNDFGVNFQIPIKNTGNVHIRPKGKITLLDEAGVPLKAIGRESIVDENGVVISESTVDYIPLNNQQSAILPNSDRIFENTWQGFIEEYTDRYGKKQYRYLTPSEKSAGRSLNERLFPWEKLETKKVQKQLTAQIDVEYDKQDGTKQEFHAAPKFLVVYDEAKVVINYWSLALILIPIVVLL